MAVGNPQIIDALMRVKSNLDSGASQRPAHGDRRARRPATRSRATTPSTSAVRDKVCECAAQARTSRDAAEGEPLRLGEGAAA